MSIEGDHHISLETMLHKLVESQETMLNKLVESQEAMIRRLVGETQNQLKMLVASLVTTQQQPTLAQNVANASVVRRSSDCLHGQTNLFCQHRLDDKGEEVETSICKQGQDDEYDDSAPSFQDGQNDATKSMDRRFRRTQEPGNDLHFLQLRRSTFTGTPTLQDSTVITQQNSDNYGGTVGSELVPFWEAVEHGDWSKAKEFLDIDSGLLTARHTSYSETALMIATKNNKSSFVEELVKLMPPRALELQDTKFGSTALHIAVTLGNAKAAKVMVNRNRNLTQIPDMGGIVPLELAARLDLYGQEELLTFLCAVTRDEDPSPFTERLICHMIDRNFYAIALSVLQRYPRLVTERTPGTGICAFELIARRPYAFLSGSKLTFWQRCIYRLIPIEDMAISDASFHHGAKADLENPMNGSESSTTGVTERTLTNTFLAIYLRYFTRVNCIKRVYNQKLLHKQALAVVKFMLKHLYETNGVEFLVNSSFLESALKYGTNEILVECLRVFPYLVWRETNGKMLLKIAIEERNESITNLICKIGGESMHHMVSHIDENGNTYLHLAAKLAPACHLNLISGAALQMQREIQWFKAVESILLERHILRTNRDDITAELIFLEEHKQLLKDGEEWMKGTSESCMLVAALVATVAFAAAFTVPGGNYSDSSIDEKGFPIFLPKPSFLVFAVADAFALFSSITSLLMFLAILTSRYAAEDFLKSLPQKMMIGLAMLFISIASTMVAFSAALSIVLGHRLTWVPIATALLGCVPVALFGFLQFPLLYAMFCSTYWPVTFHKEQYMVKPKEY